MPWKHVSEPLINSGGVDIFKFVTEGPFLKSRSGQKKIIEYHLWVSNEASWNTIGNESVDF